jgi:hypothetical protein
LGSAYHLREEQECLYNSVKKNTEKRLVRRFRRTEGHRATTLKVALESWAVRITSLSYRHLMMETHAVSETYFDK